MKRKKIVVVGGGLARHSLAGVLGTVIFRLFFNELTSPYGYKFADYTMFNFTQTISDNEAVHACMHQDHIYASKVPGNNHIQQRRI